MFGQLLLLVKVVIFVQNAVQNYAQTDAGLAELTAIEADEAMQETPGSLLEQSPTGEMIHSTLETARAARKRTP